MSLPQTEKEIGALRRKFEQAGQGQVFQYWDELDQAGRAKLASQAIEIDLDEIGGLVDQLVRGGGGQESFSGLEPAPYIARPENGGDRQRWKSAHAAGAEALRAGRVAAFTVAGGQGTRLGFDGPKGTFRVTPVTGKTLFQLFAEKIRATQRRFDTTIHWFIMTSPVNHEATVAFFDEHRNFRLDPGQVHFFSQGTMPATDPEGRIILESKDSIARSPDGHGGSLRALVRSGAVETMKRLGADILSYFQVDNPLVQCVDPSFIGFHLLEESEMSSKMIPKAYPGEKMGVFCRRNNGVAVIEYSDMPEAMQEERDASGNLRYLAGSIAIHVLSRSFVEKVGAGDDPACKLPFHRAHKKIPALGPSGETVKPQEPNGYKFEMFVFDAIPFAKNAQVVETLRADEFSPVKNAEGLDSPQTSRDDQLRQFARWAMAAGETIEVDETLKPAFNFEVSPLFALTEEQFVANWNALSFKPDLVEGTVIEPPGA